MKNKVMCVDVNRCIAYNICKKYKELCKQKEEKKDDGINSG